MDVDVLRFFLKVRQQARGIFGCPDFPVRVKAGCNICCVTEAPYDMIRVTRRSGVLEIPPGPVSLVPLLLCLEDEGEIDPWEGKDSALGAQSQPPVVWFGRVPSCTWNFGSPPTRSLSHRKLR